jgi:cysteine-rich repeat protein
LNGTFGTANAYAVPFFAAINPVGDLDCVSFDAAVDDVGDFLHAQTFGSDGVPCARMGLAGADTQLDIFDTDGTTLLVNDDDGSPDGFCSLAVAPIDAAGSYFVCVRASNIAGSNDSFPYELSIEVVLECGNEIVTAPEECDDANSVAGDGCSPTCTNELCQAPATAALGINAGDTAGSFDVTDSTCATGVGVHPEEVWSFTPATTGTLSITLGSVTDQGVSVRTTCADPATEVLCIDDELGGVDELLEVPVTAGVPVTIIVEPFGTAVGPYGIRLEMEP